MGDLSMPFYIISSGDEDVVHIDEKFGGVFVQKGL
jgi:hypothetical protein